MVTTGEKKLEKQKLAVFPQHGPEGTGAQPRGTKLPAVGAAARVVGGAGRTAVRFVSCRGSGPTPGHVPKPYTSGPRLPREGAFPDFSTSLPRKILVPDLCTRRQRRAIAWRPCAGWGGGRGSLSLSTACTKHPLCSRSWATPTCPLGENPCFRRAGLHPLSGCASHEVWTWLLGPLGVWLL